MSEQLIKTPGVFGENGNFLLERELGSGGMGGVYMGRDKMLDRPVAVKVMLKELGADAEFVEKFKKEAQSAARLIHPNIAQVYSYGICDGMPYIAMELAAGGSLYSIMTSNPGKTDIPRVIKICQQVAQALQCASDQGCVHGDVKPENILLDANGNAKLVDFGLAAMQKDTQEIWGTPYYISPEKVKKESIDFRSDMYSLGGTLYHALTGVAPFEGEDSIAVVKKRFEGAPKKPSEIRPEISAAIDGLVMKMLALDKADRYPSFEALLEAFRNVLTSGLTRNAAPAKPAATGTKGTKPGLKRPLTVHGRRPAMATAKTGGATLKKGGTPALKRKINLPEDEKQDAEEESGGSLGLKVVGVIVGTIVLIAAVAGGLIWYQVADKNSRAADEIAQITGGIDKARAAIAETVAGAAKFADEFETFAARAAEECQKPTDELKKMLPEAQGVLLKPGPTKELLDAIAATNETQQAAAPAATNAAPATAKPPTAPAAAPAAKKEAVDPAATNAAPESAGTDPVSTNAAPAAAAEEKKPEPPPQVVITMNELWERAYSCQACAVRIRHKVRQIIKKGAEADAIKGQTKEDMEKLADLSRDVVDMLDQVKTSKDVETVRKGITFIKTKGEKTVEQTVKRLRIEKLEADRKAKAEAEAAAEKERLEKIAAEKKAKVESEISAAKEKFAAIVTQGCFRQLDWKSALRQLELLKSEFKTPEGELAADLEIRKVNDMKKVQDIFIANLKGYVFKGKLRNSTVVGINEKDIILSKGGTGKIKVPWQKFYRDYPGNLNEIINAYIVNARQPSAKNKLTLREWADAMTGAALTMQLVCSEVNGAIERSQTLVKMVLEKFPDYEKTVKDIFPDMDAGASAGGGSDAGGNSKSGDDEDDEDEDDEEE